MIAMIARFARRHCVPAQDDDASANRIDPARAMPDCNALQATVKCEGIDRKSVV